MKIKSKTKKIQPAKKSYGGYKKYDIGGGSTAPGVGQGEGNWTNLPDFGNSNTPTIGAETKKSNVSASQIGGYVAAGANALSPLWEGSQFYKAPENTTVHKVGTTVKSIASNIPVAGAFVQAGDALGKGFDTGINKAVSNIANHKGNQSSNEAGAGAMSFFKGMTDPISGYETIDKLRKAGKLSTGAAVGYGLTHLLGGPGVTEAILQKKYRKELHPDAYNKEQIQATPIDQDSQVNPQFADGGFGDKQANPKSHLLEKYRLNKHSQLNPNFANAELDGQPIQMEKNETIFRAANGGDYAFSPNLKTNDGKTFAEKSIELEKTHKKPYFDKVAEDTTKLALNNLVKKNETSRIEKEQKKDFTRARGGKAPFTEFQPKTFDFNNQEEPVEISNKYSNLLETNLAPSNTNITKYPTTELRGSDKPNSGSEPNLTTGDWLQLAGQAPALGYNLARAFQKPEKQRLYTDNTNITPQQIAKDYNPMFLSENAANQDIDNNSLSDSIRRANRVAITSNTQRNVGTYGLNVDNANKGLKTQFEERLSGQTRYNNGQRLLTDDINSKNKAARNAFGAAAATQLGQGITEFGKAKNQGKTNEIGYAVLQSMAANFGLDPKEYADFLKSKGVKIKYK